MRKGKAAMAKSPMRKRGIVISNVQWESLAGWAKKRSIGAHNRRQSGAVRAIIKLAQEAEALGGLEELIRRAREAEKGEGR